MTTMNVLDAAGSTVAVEKPLTPGTAADAASRPVAFSTEGKAQFGSLTETAPATDTASSGLNGRLQRIAQRITSLIALLPASLGAGGGLKVDGSGTALPVTATLGAETTKVIGVVRNADGSGNLLTSTGGAIDINLKSGGTPVGNGADAAGALVTFSTEGKGQIGSLTETAPTTDTASSGLNGRLQRIAQRLTTMLAAFLPTATANGTTSSRVNSAASTNATSLKASAGQGYEFDLFNNAAYTVFLKLYNKASAPTVGTDTPMWTIPIQAGGGYSKSLRYGKTFSTGIAYAITKLQADFDTTSVAAGDLTGSIDWI